MLNKIRVNNIDDDVEKLLKVRLKPSKDENEPVTKRNDTFIKNYLSGELYTIEAESKIPDNCKYLLATIQVAQNQKQTNKHRRYSKVTQVQNWCKSDVSS